MNDESRPPASRHRALREPLIAFLVATAIASALYWSARVVPFVAGNLHGAIAIVFLYVPWVAARVSRRSFDYAEAGLTIEPLGRNLVTCGLAVAVAWPAFFLAFLGFYGFGCRTQQPAFALWMQSFAPICPRWLGFGGASFHLPPRFGLLALSQLVVVAVPEELFFRGYLWTRLSGVWEAQSLPRFRVFGVLLGPTWLATSLLFALGHVLVDFDIARLAVFFPALVFGWMRARTGSIAAGALFHALCNLLSDLLHHSFFSPL